MTSAEIRQSFLDFFARHGHTIVPSASLLPDSPGLLFTNAGMNQFVPIFLGDRAPDVASWAGALPAKNTRAADTQKCIRAGGKHNDLEDVGYDTYHHTMFEMLGNWSFGDYFKQDSLTWGWELITKVWGIPAKRLFATVYAPDKTKGDPSDFDQEAYDIWAGLFRAEGLDPAVHIVNGNKKDNFWMMGDTGPCGPCSEIHFNLLPSDDESAGRQLVNASSPRCIEIWNHVFIQFNANADGTFSPLAAKHVDTGMGFERVAGIYATTNGFTDFTKDPSNYAADVFAPSFRKIAELSGHTYHATVPTKREGLTEQENIDVAFRVLADHARCVSCAIADSILPGNEGRNYVIRRILRRGILYGKKLGLAPGFFEQLVAPVVESLGAVFPELVSQQEVIRRVIRGEEESFGRTLDRGLSIFNSQTAHLTAVAVPGALAFELYDTYGFPLDMTQLLATERGLTVDTGEFERLMGQQRERARAAHKKDILVAATEGDASEIFEASLFTGYVVDTEKPVAAILLDIVHGGDAAYLVFDRTPFYAEMGGQAGDTGTAVVGGQTFNIVDTIKDKAGRHLHKLATDDIRYSASALRNSPAQLTIDFARRRAISRHHSAAHLIHWALRQTLGTHVRQAGTSKTPDRMRFDFSHFEAMTPEQLHTVEHLVNEKVIDNARVETYETEFDKKPEGTLAFFGDKYGKIVRVVDIGGYSRELCGGTHVTTTGEIGPIKLVAEMAIAAGTRRIEAVAGEPALAFIAQRDAALAAVNARLNAGTHDVAQKLDSLLAHQKELEKKLRAFEQRAAAALAGELAAQAVERDGLKFVRAVVSVEAPETLRSLGAQILGHLGEGVVVLGAAFGEKTSLVVLCSPAAIKAGHQAGKLVAHLSQQLGGKGGGKPDFAMGGGKEPGKLAELLRTE
ncbi:alanine--tRNA ligase [Horticoccus luteus]|uniref:Alanine--tRNA ligase n=1 Tax=Horticoccus luteus TaxID=2862869 RepID=A0A8F9XK13_9BACT|nr:alanine--tRNA ligase [Horticoccus luteus]QYM77726.1 alanine--tRNA ligase [Horticoccus luteus]